MKGFFPYLIFLMILFTSSCKKSNKEYFPTSDPGVFTCEINNTSWNPNKHRATYYSKWGELHIYAEDLSTAFQGAVLLDMVSPLRSYPLKSHGDNGALYVMGNGNDRYNTDYDIPGIGGVFNLTKFDTIDNKVSGQFNFIAYGKDRTTSLNFTNNVITDIPLTIDTTAYKGSYASCTFTGATTANWYTKNFNKYVYCMTAGGTDKNLQIEINTILGGYPLYRCLEFKIPLDLPAGSYPIYNYSIDQCSYLENKISSIYRMNNSDYNYSYHPSSGTISILSIDTTERKIFATFNMILKDSLTNQLIQVSNGQFYINGWRIL